MELLMPIVTVDHDQDLLFSISAPHFIIDRIFTEKLRSIQFIKDNQFAMVPKKKYSTFRLYSHHKGKNHAVEVMLWRLDQSQLVQTIPLSPNADQCKLRLRFNADIPKQDISRVSLVVVYEDSQGVIQREELDKIILLCDGDGSPMIHLHQYYKALSDVTGEEYVFDPTVTRTKRNREDESGTEDEEVEEPETQSPKRQRIAM